MTLRSAIITGTASININGTVGATTPTTGAFTTVAAATTVGVGGATPSASGAGISFPATQSASTDANTLDDYEEGTFTPVLLFNGANVGMTYGTQLGRYTKIGNRVYFNAYIYPINKGSSTGAVAISGLPFTSNSTSGNAHALSVFLNTFTFGVSLHPTARIIPSATSIQIYFMTTGTAAQMVDTQVNVVSEFTVTGFYEV